MTDMFDFNQSPQPFKTIPAPLPPSFFLRQSSKTYDPPDDL